MKTYNNGLTLALAIANIFDAELSDEEIIDIWNEYCDANRYYDNRIHSMDVFDEFFDSYTPTQIADMVSYNGSDYQRNADYFTYDEVCNDLRTYYSASGAVDGAVERDDLIEWLERSGQWEDFLSDYIEEDDNEEE